MNRMVLIALAAAATLTVSPALARDRHHGGGYNRGGHAGISINIGRGGGYYGGYGGGYRYAPQPVYYNDPYYDQRVSYRQRGYYDDYRGYRRDHHDSRREYRRHWR